MNDRQIDLILEIIDEQLNDYLSEELATEIMSGIKDCIDGNWALLNDLEG